MQDDTLNLQVIANDIKYIQRDVKDIKEKLQNDYITREEFAPIKDLVYGVVGLVMTAFVLAITYLVFKH